MTQAEAMALDEDLQELQALRKNRFWTNHVLPELQRLHDAARVAARDRTLSAEHRCEHVTAWEQAETMLEYLNTQEARIRANLKAFDNKTPIIERAFSRPPVG